MQPLRPAAIRAARSSAIRSFSWTARRQSSDIPYPFTKPSNAPSKTPQDQGARASYPFTKPSDPSPVSPPTGVRERPGPTVDDSEVISREAEDLDRPLPDYEGAAEYRTSTYSPVPFRVQDGSDPDGPTPAAVTSGAPLDLQARTVRIFKPTKTATQSGDWHSHHWQMDWDVMGKGHRWENPLMGWQSSGDPMQATHLNFKTKADAIHFAEKQGYEYFVQEPNERKFVVKAYANQFLHSYGPIKQVRTK